MLKKCVDVKIFDLNDRHPKNISKSDYNMSFDGAYFNFFPGKNFETISLTVLTMVIFDWNDG